MPILVLYTGGTIGMEPTDAGLAPSKNLVQKMKARLAYDTAADLSYEVVTLEPLIDSANLATEHWQAIIDTLKHHWYEFDSFVILHGTDTMAYTASILSYVFANSTKNIVLTGSQMPLGTHRSDAQGNLELALSVASGPALGHVTIAFGNKVLQGNRATKVSSQAFGGFNSPNQTPLVSNQITPEYVKSAAHTSTPSLLSQDMNFMPEAVGVIWLTPSLSPAAYQGYLHDEKCKAIVLVSFGAGNIASDNSEFCAFLANATKQGITIVNVSQCLHGGTSEGAYAAGSFLKTIGVLDGHDMTLEGAFTKLHFLLAAGHDSHQISLQWEQTLAGEWD